LKHNIENVNVNLSLYLFKHYAIKTWGGGSEAPPFLTVAPDGDEYLASCPGCFTPKERDPYALLIKYK
jgi:hypothetical protein